MPNARSLAALLTRLSLALCIMFYAMLFAMRAAQTAVPQTMTAPAPTYLEAPIKPADCRTGGAARCDAPF